MGARRIVVLLLAVVAAGATAMFARSWVQGQQASLAVAAPTPILQEEEIYEVLVADIDLSSGTFVKPQHVRWQQWPTDDVPETYVLRGERTEDDMVGAVVRYGIAAGEPMTDGGLVKPGDRGFLAAVLNPGMRAVSVPVNPTSSNSGLIFPGDRVDLILTQTLTEEGSDIPRRVSETVLEDVRILAMGAALSDRPAEGESHENARTATFEVSPQAAETVALVTELGKLSLSLRSLASDEAPVETASRARFTWDSDVSQVLNGGQGFNRLTVLRGNKREGFEIEKGAN